MKNSTRILTICSPIIGEKIKTVLDTVRNLSNDCVDNSDDALSLLKEKSYDLLFLEPDINPINGFGIVSLVRSGIFFLNANVKIVFLVSNINNQLAENTARIFKIEKVIGYKDIDYLPNQLSEVLLDVTLISPKYRVLVVDDTEDTRLIFKRNLEKRDYYVECAEDGFIGLDKLKSDNYDLVILDYMMPGISGVDFLRKVKEEGIETSVIAVTASSDVSIATNFLKNGATDFLMKPIKSKDLLHSCEKAIKQKEFLSSIPQLRIISDSQSSPPLSHIEDVSESMTSISFILDKNFRFSFLSQQWFEVSGYRVNESIGTFFSRYFSTTEIFNIIQAEFSKLNDGIKDSFSIFSKIKGTDNNITSCVIIFSLLYSDETGNCLAGQIIVDNNIMGTFDTLSIISITESESGALNKNSLIRDIQSYEDSIKSGYQLIYFFIEGYDKQIETSGLAEMENNVKEVYALISNSIDFPASTYRPMEKLFVQIHNSKNAKITHEYLHSISDYLNAELENKRLKMSISIRHSELSHDSYLTTINKLYGFNQR